MKPSLHGSDLLVERFNLIFKSIDVTILLLNHHISLIKGFASMHTEKVEAHISFLELTHGALLGVNVAAALSIWEVVSQARERFSLQMGMAADCLIGKGLLKLGARLGLSGIHLGVKFGTGAWIKDGCSSFVDRRLVLGLARQGSLMRDGNINGQRDGLNWCHGVDTNGASIKLHAKRDNGAV